MKRRVPLHGKAGFVDVDPTATPGAVVGTNLLWPDGSVVAEADLRAAVTAGTPDPNDPAPEVVATIWSYILQIPATVRALAAATGTGLFAVTGSATGAFRTITGTARVAVTNGSGVAGNPTIDLETLADGGTGALLAITRDTYGRVSGSRAVVSADFAPGMVPFEIQVGETFTVAAGKQALFTVPIDVGTGTLDVAGVLVEVA